MAAASPPAVPARPRGDAVHSIGPFILGKTLGTGATGKVKLAFHKDTSMKVAVKIVSKETMSQKPNMRKKLEREIAIMKLISHPSVLRFLDVYETTKYLFIVTEYVEGGELFDYLVKRGFLEPNEALNFFQQIINGLECCHHHLVCHRDLKPENILLDAERRIKIADFGMATQMRQGSMLETSCGSPHYASPEVILGHKYDGRAADVWSCGVILYALLTGKLPFDDDNIRKLLDKVKAGAFTLPAYLNKDVKDLISRMLTIDPSKRITIAEIRAHPWFCSQMLAPAEPLSPLDEYAADPVAELDQDPELLRNLRALGWGHSIEELSVALSSPPRNHVKVFYRLLERRKRTEGRLFDPETPAIKRVTPSSKGRSQSVASRSEAHETNRPELLRLNTDRALHVERASPSTERAATRERSGEREEKDSRERDRDGGTPRKEKDRHHALREDRRKAFATAATSPVSRSTGIIDTHSKTPPPEKRVSAPQKKAMPPLERRKSVGDAVALLKRTEVHTDSQSSQSVSRPAAENTSLNRGSTNDLQTLVPSGAGKQKSWLSTIFSGGRLPTRTISSPKTLPELLNALGAALTKLGAKYSVRKSTVRGEVGSALRFEIEVAENRVDDVTSSSPAKSREPKIDLDQKRDSSPVMNVIHIPMEARSKGAPEGCAKIATPVRTATEKIRSPAKKSSRSDHHRDSGRRTRSRSRSPSERRHKHRRESRSPREHCRRSSSSKRSCDHRRPDRESPEHRSKSLLRDKRHWSPPSHYSLATSKSSHQSSSAKRSPSSSRRGRSPAKKRSHRDRSRSPSHRSRSHRRQTRSRSSSPSPRRSIVHQVLPSHPAKSPDRRPLSHVQTHIPTVRSHPMPVVPQPGGSWQQPPNYLPFMRRPEMHLPPPATWPVEYLNWLLKR